MKKRRKITIMKIKSKSFVFADVLFILMMTVPVVVGMVLKILTTPASDDIVISGAQIYFTLNMPLQDLPITESQVNSLIVIITVIGLCLFLTHGIRANVKTRRQLLAEFLVEKVDGMVNSNMGDYFKGYAPFIAAMLALSALSSLLSLFGLYAPTSDINIVAGWAILVFILITYYKLKCGPWHYIKSFGDPVPFLAPMNIISEVATPFSMAFRHYGNVLSGSIVGILLASALGGLSTKVVGSLPGFLGDFPIFRIGIPAVVSIYFDIFGGLLQAYIFAVLTMLYVSSGFPQSEYEKRKLRKMQKKIAAKK
jgi:F-type H+-transporting ATPase subunit a